MKKMCFVTAARSEYGLLKWLMHDVNNSGNFRLQLIVTGAHLLEEQGYTVEQIIEDGFIIDETIDAHLDTTSTATIAAYMGRLAELIAPVFERLKPDYVVVLGDRYELLPICNVAFVMRIPIIHLSGGDVTEGAIDDGIRNTVSILADIHFPGTEESASNIARIRGNGKNIWTVGEPGLDSFNRETLMPRDELANNLGLDKNKRWVLMTYHSETKLSLGDNLEVLENCIKLLLELSDYQIVATYANADFGGRYINDILEKTAVHFPEKFRVIPSLGHIRYLSYMKEAAFVIGNSSSGIVEAPMLKVPVVNIGDRQKGRYQCNNVIQSATDYVSLKESINLALNKTIVNTDLDYWGNGYTSKHIMKILGDICE